MNKSVHITCPTCGYMIKGRPWRCPECGDTDNHKKGKAGKSRRGFRERIVDALRARKAKAL